MFHASQRDDPTARAIKALGIEAIAQMPDALARLPRDEVPLRAFDTVGLPALDLVLQHESEVTEAQQNRKVKLDIKAVALGPMAEKLNRQEIGLTFGLAGFLGAPRTGRGVLLHITELNDIV